jgi:hypothetical protein
MQVPSDLDHVIDIIPLRQAGPEKDAADVHIVGNVAAGDGIPPRIGGAWTRDAVAAMNDPAGTSRS